MNTYENIKFSNKIIKDKIKEAFIRSDVMGSDHCPVGLEIEL